MKALIATDGSPGSFAAIRLACRILSPERDQVVLYCSPPTVGLKEHHSNSIKQFGSAFADSVFAEATEHLPQSWKTKVQKIIRDDDPRIGIVSVADECGAEIIVVGARGLGAVARMFLGSVSRSVVHSAKLPVLVVRSSPDDPGSKPLRVLVACENSVSSLPLVECLHKFSWSSESSCTALMVVPSLLGGSIPKWLAAPARPPEVEQLTKVWAEEERIRLTDAQAEIQLVSAALLPLFERPSAIVAQGNPGTEIIDLARKERSNLIVVGSKGTTPLGRFFIGSTCESVLNHAPCSVLVIHHA